MNSSAIDNYSKGWIEMKSKADDSISLLHAQKHIYLFFIPLLINFNGFYNLHIIESIKKINIEIAE